MIPQSEPEHKDLVDVLIQSVQRLEEVQQEDGSIEKNLIIDPKSLYWKTNIVASANLSRFVFELENLYNMGRQAYNFMSINRAKSLEKQIAQLVGAYMYSIDAKSSESLRSNGSAQSTLLDKVARNKIERSYKVEGEKRRSFLEDMMGKDKEEDMDRD